MLARPRSVSGRPGTAAASSVTPGRPAGRQRGGDLRGGAEPAAQGRGPARRWRRAGGCGRRPRPPRQGAAPELRREHRAPAAVPAAKAAAAPAARPPRAAPSVPSSPRGAAQRGAAAATGGPRAGRVATKPPPTPTAAALPAVGGPDSPPAQQRENERGGMRPEARGCRRRDASQLRALRDGAGGARWETSGGPRREPGGRERGRLRRLLRAAAGRTEPASASASAKSRLRSRPSGSFRGLAGFYSAPRAARERREGKGKGPGPSPPPRGCPARGDPRRPPALDGGRAGRRRPRARRRRAAGSGAAPTHLRRRSSLSGAGGERSKRPRHYRGHREGGLGAAGPRAAGPAGRSSFR